MAKHVLKSTVASWCLRIQSRAAVFTVSQNRNQNTLSSASNLENKVALVTGSRRGIGLGIAAALAQRGCHVILNGTSDDSLAASIKSQLSRCGGIFRVSKLVLNQIFCIFNSSISKNPVNY